MINYIAEYNKKIQSGEIIAPEWIKLFYKYIENGLNEGLFFYNEKKAGKAIKFIETFCHHCEGRNDLLKLELWQKALVSCLFGIIDTEGNRQARECFLVVGRKNGKSLLSAAIIAYMVFADGEHGANAYCVAPKLDQANIIYHAFWETIKSEPELRRLIKSRKSDYYIESTNSSIKKVAFSSSKSDGYNPHAVVLDELASFKGEQGMRQYEVMKSAFGSRRQGLLLGASTAGYIRGGIYDELMMRATRFLLGDSKEKRFFPFLYIIDDEDRWNDIEELKKSNPNLGVSVTESYLKEEIAVAEGSLSKLAEFKTKYCNIPQNSSQAWLSTKAIKTASCEELTPEQFAHSYCTIGIDLSQAVDLTAAVIDVEKNGVDYIIAHFWLPEEKLEEATARDGLPYREFIQKGWLTLSGQSFIDYRDVYNWVTDLVQTYELLPLKIGYDRYSSQYLIQELEAYGAQCDDVYQGYNLTPIINELEGKINEGLIKVGNNDLLKIHLLDTAVYQDNESRRRKIIKISQTAHIDGTAALLCALCVKNKWHDQIGEQLKNL